MSDFFSRVMEIKREGNLEKLGRVIPYASFIKIGYERDGEGLIVVLNKSEDNVGNSHLLALHGGVVGALLEQAGIMQVIWECELTRFPKIINLSVDYLRPSLGARDTRARASLIKQGRSVTNVRVTAWQSDPDKLVAAANMHLLMR